MLTVVCSFGIFVVVVVLSQVSLCSSGCPGTRSVDQAASNLRDLPASASQVLGLKVYRCVYPLPIFFPLRLHCN